MDIQMVDLKGLHDRIRDEIDSAVRTVIDDAHFIKGTPVGEFECALAGYMGGRYALGVGNGTDALQISMMALDIGPGDEVITTAFTFIATAEAAALLGATPVFADIDQATFNIDPEAIESLITPKTKAIVPVHLFGQPADMDPILEIAARHGVAVVEDNAQAVGATYRGRRTGYIGSLGTLSFFPSKNLGAFGDGGAITTNDRALYERCRKIANHGGSHKYRNEVVGVNSRLDTLQAAILLVKLRHLDSYSTARREAADRYDERLGSLEGIAIPFRDSRCEHVFHQYTIRVSQDLPGGRDALVSHLKAAHVPHAVYYPTALHELPVFRDAHASFRAGDLSRTQAAAEEVLSLPMHTELSAKQQRFICDSISEFVHSAARAGA